MIVQSVFKVSCLVVLFLLLVTPKSFAQSEKLIFPTPFDVQLMAGRFIIDTSTEIIVTKNNSNNFLSRLFLNELADVYGETIRINREGAILKEKSILIGDVSDPLVKQYCEKNRLTSSLKTLGNEGYILTVSNKNIVVAANTNVGAMWGLQSLRQILYKQGDKLLLPELIVKDAPKYSFRGIKLYLPGKENIPFFKRFIKDFVVQYKYNKIILELNANMRLYKHPELNIGAVEFAKYLNSRRLDRPPGVHKEYQNSSHQDNADGGILEKEEVADVVKYIRKFDIEVIPELPSLTHSYYLLSAHKELAENMAQPYPDTYCPLKPGSYKLYFDVLDEYIDVIHPAMVHVGHDEWRMEKDLCELCRGKDYGVLYANDLKKIHDHLAAKGIKTAIWGDHLLETVTEKDHQTWKTSTGYTYKIPGALRPEQVIKLIPKDIIVFNWFWNDINNDKQLSDFGFSQVYGNLRPDINHWQERSNIKGVMGAAPSSWAATTPLNIGKDQLYDFLADANLLWSKHTMQQDKVAYTIEPLVTGIYKKLNSTALPIDDKARMSAINISSSFNSDLSDKANELGNAQLINRDIKAGDKTFSLSSSKEQNNQAIVVNNNVRQSKPFPINRDVNSLIFLHACTNEAVNDKAYSMIYDFDDTAEPLGYYEILYEDGMVETVPIRYGVNILDWKWRQRIINNEVEKRKYSQNKYAYNAAAVECSADTGKPITFFSFEWHNDRLGKKIKEVSLNSVDYKKGNENAIILLAVDASETESVSNAKGTEAQ